MTARRPELVTQLLRRFDLAESERLATELDLLNIAPEFIEGLIDAGDRLPLVDPPPGLSGRLSALFECHAPTARNGFDLVFDSRSEPALAGVRGAAGGSGWTIAYESDDCDLIVDINPRPADRFDIEITLITKGESKSIETPTVSLGETGHPVDALGRTRFVDVGRGVHRLTCGFATSSTRYVTLEI